MLPLVWDLDGTLVDTKQANRLAYKSLGINPPDDFHVRPWQEWCSEEVHDEKGKIIGRFILNHARPLQLLNVWEANGRGKIITNASTEAIQAIRNTFPQLADADIKGGLRSYEKTAWLRVYAPTGVYFDDSEKTIALVKEETRWTAVLVRS